MKSNIKKYNNDKISGSRPLKESKVIYVISSIGKMKNYSVSEF